MLLLDSLYINNSGGKILLDYIVSELEASGMDVFYLFDARCQADYTDIPNERKLYMEASLVNRHRFYLKHRKRFAKVFCFGNLAPTVRLSVPVYTYFHQLMFLSVPHTFPAKKRMVFGLKSRMFRFLLRNTDYLLLQSANIKAEFCAKMPGFSPERVLVLPFYEPMQCASVEKEKNSFIYVSGGSPHKNHAALLQAFTAFYDEYRTGKLILTIDSSSAVLHEQIEQLAAEGYPIVNLGFIPKKDLAIHYARAEYVIYPSLAESFGLGIVEGIEAGCKVIGADLPYMRQVCSPSIAFNPREPEAIKAALIKAVKKEETATVKKIKNEIEELIKLLG